MLGNNDKIFPNISFFTFSQVTQFLRRGCVVSLDFCLNQITVCTVGKKEWKPEKAVSA